jgi:hypothetical protein
LKTKKMKSIKHRVTVGAYPLLAAVSLAFVVTNAKGIAITLGPNQSSIRSEATSRVGGATFDTQDLTTFSQAVSTTAAVPGVTTTASLSASNDTDIAIFAGTGEGVVDANGRSAINSVHLYFALSETVNYSIAGEFSGSIPVPADMHGSIRLYTDQGSTIYSESVGGFGTSTASGTWDGILSAGEFLSGSNVGILGPGSYRVDADLSWLRDSGAGLPSAITSGWFRLELTTSNHNVPDGGASLGLLMIGLLGLGSVQQIFRLMQSGRLLNG